MIIDCNDNFLLKYLLFKVSTDYENIFLLYQRFYLFYMSSLSSLSTICLQYAKLITLFYLHD